jgi:hypothetical protein
MKLSISCTPSRKFTNIGNISERIISLANRSMLGLPSKWSTVLLWLSATFAVKLPEPTPASQKDRLFPDIPLLQDYEKEPPVSFWHHFLSNSIPLLPETKINVKKLEELVKESEYLLLKLEISRAKNCIEFLTLGASAFQNSPLPGCLVKNSKNAILYGTNVTDTVASWVEKKFVAGPFSTPPLPEVRANSILAVPQPSKTRICINVSLPSGKIFNDNIKKFDLESVKMSSARNFGYSITETGRNSTIAEHDIVDAYKNVPAKISDLRY